MNKEMDNKATFNPADYDYLDNSTLEDWVSEILDRNRDFKSQCSKIFSENKEGYRVRLSEYKVWVPASEKKAQYTESGKLKVILIRQPVKVYRLLGKEDRESVKESGVLYKTMGNAVINDHWETWVMCNHDFRLNRDDNLSDTVDAWIGEPNKDGEYDIGDTLLLAIDMNYGKKDIQDYIEQIMKIHKPKKKERRRMDKWKYYLIAFDLREQGLSYSEIADQLIISYPDDENLFDERNIENYYGNALKLINGGYKLYY